MGQLCTMQEEISVWAMHNFGNVPAWQPLLGVVEEMGELADVSDDHDAANLLRLARLLSHAHLKQAQGIRGSQEQHRADQLDAVADIIVYLLDFGNRMQIDVEQALQMTWAKVKQRDWLANPLTGSTQPLGS